MSGAVISVDITLPVSKPVRPATYREIAMSGQPIFVAPTLSVLKSVRPAISQGIATNGPQTIAMKTTKR